jgi:hypothetical protein
MLSSRRLLPSSGKSGDSPRTYTTESNLSASGRLWETVLDSRALLSFHVPS